MLEEIRTEAVPESEVPTGRGRPGPTLPAGLLASITKSADEGVWLSARFTSPEEAEELTRLLHYVHRSTRYAYHVATRHEQTADGHRVLFRAEHHKAEHDG